MRASGNAVLADQLAAAFVAATVLTVVARALALFVLRPLRVPATAVTGPTTTRSPA